MVLRFTRKSRRPEIEIPELKVPEIEIPSLEREDLARVLRRAAIYLVPAIVTFAFFTLIAWAIRRRLTLPDEITLEPIVGEAEPAYEVPA